MTATTEKIAPDHSSTVDETLPDPEQKVDNLHTDIGLSYYQRALEIDPVTRDAIARRVKKKIDCFLLPAVILNRSPIRREC